VLAHGSFVRTLIEGVLECSGILHYCGGSCHISKVIIVLQPLGGWCVGLSCPTISLSIGNSGEHSMCHDLAVTRSVPTAVGSDCVPAGLCSGGEAACVGQVLGRGPESGVGQVPESGVGQVLARCGHGPRAVHLSG
jgi:hypothetical protein